MLILMSKKKPPAKDRHKSNPMVRLTPRAEAILAAIVATSRRAKTVEIELALESHAKTVGITVPPLS